MRVYFSGKQIDVNVKRAGFLGKFFGLMFRSKNSSNLLFDFGESTRISLHSFFVFFDFLVLWLDDKNNVLDYQVCSPFMLRISTRKPFKKVIELPLNRNNYRITRFFVGKRNI